MKWRREKDVFLCNLTVLSTYGSPTSTENHTEFTTVYTLLYYISLLNSNIETIFLALLPRN